MSDPQSSRSPRAPSPTPQPHSLAGSTSRPSRPRAATTPSRPPSPPPGFSHLKPVLSLSHAHQPIPQHHSILFATLSRVYTNRVPPVDDGFTNEPVPLPHNAAALERRLTRDPDVERQMAEGDIGPPPEGGVVAWGVVASAFFVLFCVFGFITSFGQLQTYYLAHQLVGYSKSTIAWISSLQAFICFAGSLFSGRYFDSHGARRPTIVGTSLTVIATVALAFCKKYYQFLLAHALFGIGGAMLYSPATAVAGHWFLRRRSTAVGIVVCGSGLGGVIYPIALKQLFDQLSFRDSILIIAGMNAALMLPSWKFLIGRLPPRNPPPLRALLGPWKEARYTCLVIGSILVAFSWLTPYFNAPVLSSANHLSNTLSSYAIALLQAGSFLGRALSGVLADRFGVWNMFISSSTLSAVVLFAFWVASPIPAPAVVVGMVLYGITSGAWITLVAASVGSISPTKEFGMRLGMVWSCTSLGILLGPVISGVLIQAEPDKTFKYAGIFCGFMALAGSAMTIAPRAIELITQTMRRGKDPEGIAEKAEDSEAPSQ